MTISYSDIQITEGSILRVVHHLKNAIAIGCVKIIVLNTIAIPGDIYSVWVWQPVPPGQAKLRSHLGLYSIAMPRIYHVPKGGFQSIDSSNTTVQAFGMICYIKNMHHYGLLLSPFSTSLCDKIRKYTASLYIPIQIGIIVYTSLINTER